jgi:hypothetical protein
LVTDKERGVLVVADLVIISKGVDTAAVLRAATRAVLQVDTAAILRADTTMAVLGVATTVARRSYTTSNTGNSCNVINVGQFIMLPIRNSKNPVYCRCQMCR